MKRYIKAVPGKGIVANKQIYNNRRKVICSTMDEILKGDWESVADHCLERIMEHPGISASLTSPEDAAIRGLSEMKSLFELLEEDGELDEYLTERGIPTDIVLTKELAQKLKPIFVKSASGYDFSSEYDDDYLGW